MLLKFQVKNFKQFENLELDFQNVRDYIINKDCLTKKADVLKTLLVYGPNASGKSNLGLAIFDIVQHLFDHKTDPAEYAYYLNADNPKEPASFLYKFKFGKTIVQYEYSKLNAKKVVAEALYVNDKLVFSLDKITKEENFSHLKEWGLASLNNLFKDDNMSFLRYAANNANLKENSPIIKLMNFVGSMLWFRRADVGNNFIGLHNRVESIDQFIVDNGLIDKYEQFLSQYGVNEKLEVIELPDRKEIYSRHKQKLPFFAIMSSGTSALSILFYWSCFFNQASFIFIDEFDASYQTKVSVDVFKFLKTLNQQVMLTTHNTNLLNNSFTRADCCFELREGIIKSLADRTKREIRSGNNLEKLYLAGEFDGDA